MQDCKESKFFLDENICMPITQKHIKDMNDFEKNKAICFPSNDIGCHLKNGRNNKINRELLKHVRNYVVNENRTDSRMHTLLWKKLSPKEVKLALLCEEVKLMYQVEEYKRQIKK